MGRGVRRALLRPRRSSQVWTQPRDRCGGGRGSVPQPPSPGPPGVTHPEHCGVNDERELEPEVGEARAVAHLLRVPAGHPGHTGRGSPGAPWLGPWQRAAPPAAACRATGPATGARSGTDTSELQSQPGPGTSQPRWPMGARHRPSLWEEAGWGRGYGPRPRLGEPRGAEGARVLPRRSRATLEAPVLMGRERKCTEEQQGESERA